MKTIEVIASGSIGQAYKIKSKYDNKYYALKSIHPDVTSRYISYTISI